MGQSFRDDREFDLFGNPVRCRKGQRGRPPLEIDPQDRDAVEAALARGWSNARIAKTIGISVASLKRHFRAALDDRDVARDKLELAAFAKLSREAIENGNMSAMKQLREILARDMLTKQQEELARRQEEADAIGLGGLGKKEAAQRRAEQAVEDDQWGGLLKPDGMH